jgi:hypothetical protein
MQSRQLTLVELAYWLIGALAVSLMVAKIVGAENLYEPSRYAAAHPKSYRADDPTQPTRTWPSERPEPGLFFSSNDRSRWATIRALVDEGTYQIGQRDNFKATAPPYQDRGIIFEDDYKSLDKVMNPDTGAYYSSKPPLLATVLAGEYWFLKQAFGWDIVKDRWLVVCTMLISVNVVPFVLYLLVLAQLLRQVGTSDAARLLAFLTAALGTFLTTFCHTLNNHTPAAYCALFAVYPLLRSKADGEAESRRDLAVSGFFCGLLAALELPAASFAVSLCVLVVYLRTVRALVWMVPFAILPSAAQVVCNFIALGTWEPAYSNFGGPWYNYPGSHWAKWQLVESGQFVPGIDFNQEPMGVYAFHLLVGHHGWFSLTPLFLVSLYGLVASVTSCWHAVLARLGRAIAPTERVVTFDILSLITLLVTAVVLGFYLTRTQSYNYGGNTSGLRWLFWLIPLWVLPLARVNERFLLRRSGALLMCAFLALGVLAVYYPAMNPWRSPWLLQALEKLGWVNYDQPPSPLLLGG